MKLASFFVRSLTYYLVTCAVLVHVLVAYLVLTIYGDRIISGLSALPARFEEPVLVDSRPVISLPRTPSGSIDSATIPRGSWLKVHQQQATDEIRFQRQRHSGSAWDSRRGRLLLFGSDTHGANIDNSLYSFDLEEGALAANIPTGPPGKLPSDARGYSRGWAGH